VSCNCIAIGSSAQPRTQRTWSRRPLLAAWRGLDEFTERASIRTWLYRIATNRCIDSLRASARRRQSIAPMTELPEPSRVNEPIWLQPYPDVAEMLDTTEAAVNSLLRRARAALESRLPAAGRERAPLPNSRHEREVVGQFANAIEDGNIDAIVALLTHDAWLTMPPYPYEHQGGAAIGQFLQDRAAHRGGPLRIVPTRANGQPGFGCYFPCPHTEIARPYGLLVLTLAGTKIAEITFFADSSVFPHFGLPRTLPSRRR
jgi:hypothetical protein